MVLLPGRRLKSRSSATSELSCGRKDEAAGEQVWRRERDGAGSCGEILGVARTTDLMLRGRMMDAAECLSIGIINTIVTILLVSTLRLRSIQSARSGSIPRCEANQSNKLQRIARMMSSQFTH